MRFGVLGPLHVLTGDTGEPGIALGIRLRVLLAVLLWHPNQPVSADELAELIWDGGPPAGAPGAIRTLVMRLRRQLGPDAAARIVTLPSGYTIKISSDELDATRFEALIRQAGTAVRAGQWAHAAQAAAEALELWRGTPLTDVPSRLLRDQWVPHLDKLRMQAVEWRVEGDLHDGRHEQLIPELQDLTASHPLHEHFHAQLMLALYRCGRQAEALAAYKQARDTLITEVGVEPGPDLRTLHQQILAADPALTVIVTATGPPQHAQPAAEQHAPRELPPSVPGFTGRSAELDALSQLLARLGEHVPGMVVISAIGGTAGVGKTALAVHWAHRVAARFPDGQLYVNLRGYDPDQPLAPADALAGFLRSLGVPGTGIPPELDARAARYRSLLAGKRMLILLDNAGSADQVRPLLPGAEACAVLVTSRDALAGLVARDGASRLDLDALPLPDAVALLRTLIGTRVDAEPDAAAELAGQCCRLPLALRVAAEIAASHPAVPLATLTGDLADLGRRLDLLGAGGDPRTQVRTVFSWSYRRLDADTARTFRLLGLHPGPDLDPYAAAALTDTTMPHARHALDVLTRAHLTQPAGPGRHAMHDLLRGYARELTAAHDTETDQHAALTRLFDYYLSAAATAMDTLYPAERHLRPRISPATTPVPPLADSADAREWLDSERPTFVAAAAHAANHDWPGHATQLAATLFSYFLNGGHVPEARVVFSHALDAARRTGDRAAEATSVNQLAGIELRQSRFQQAADRYREALALFRAAGDQAGEARALSNLGSSEFKLGRYERAASHWEEAIAFFRDTGDNFGEARVLGNLGLARQRQGRYQEATGHHQQTLRLFRAIGDRDGEGHTLTWLGMIDLSRGHYEEAAGCFQRALTLFQAIGSVLGEIEVLIRLGDAHLGTGRTEQAARNFERAIAMSRETGDAATEADAFNGLGEIHFRASDIGQARAHFGTALRLSSEAGSMPEQARAHSGLARACETDDDLLQARRHWHEALTRYAAIGAPEARDIRARLASSDASDDDRDPAA